MYTDFITVDGKKYMLDITYGQTEIFKLEENSYVRYCCCYSNNEDEIIEHIRNKANEQQHNH